MEEKFSSFSHAGIIHDPSLSQLREQIKKVMIPLLIKIFQTQLDLSYRAHTKDAVAKENSVEQLKTLDNDLKVLLQWCQSSRQHIQKALSMSENEPEAETDFSTALFSANPHISQSFHEIVSEESSFFQEASVGGKKTDSAHPRTWWDKFLGN